MAANIGKGRALQVCDRCGVVDDHPRHHHGGAIVDAYDKPSPTIVRQVALAVADIDPDDADRLMAELLDTGTVSLHRDCCREQGCPTGECDQLVAGGGEELRGAALLKFTTARAKEIGV